MRLDESLYSIKNIGENGLLLGESNRLVGLPVNEKSCLPPMIFQDKACSDTTHKRQLQAHREEPEDDVFVFTNDTIYIDPGISGEMKKKVCPCQLLLHSIMVDTPPPTCFRKKTIIFWLLLLIEYNIKSPNG